MLGEGGGGGLGLKGPAIKKITFFCGFTSSLQVYRFKIQNISIL